MDSDTDVMVLSFVPSTRESEPVTIEAADAVRRIVEKLEGTHRLLLHGRVNPNQPGDLEGMDELKEKWGVSAWKTYTQYGPGGKGYFLSDDVGVRFIEKARALGVKNICVHKGLPFGKRSYEHSQCSDIGLVAKRFPDVNFLIYHSGFVTSVAEQAYDESGNRDGIDTLVTSLLKNGVRPGSNVYAELGSTWRYLMRDPEQAAHALGKLIRYCGPDNVLWGTDSIWYGSPQDQIQAFSTFQISPALRERTATPRSPRALRAKIFGLNAAKVYGLSPGEVRKYTAADEMARQRRAYLERPDPHFLTYGPKTRREFLALLREGGVHRIARTMLYDLLLRGGRVIDPSQNLDGTYDVAIRDGRIAAVLPSIAPSSARETIDVSGKLVLPGLIDTHAHVFQYVTGRFGLEADLCGVRSGVTTLVDQGGPSCMTLPAFREFVVEREEEPRARLPVGLSRRRHGRALLPSALPARLRRRRRHRQGGAREPRHRQGLQGARRARRLRALGHRGDAPRGRDRPAGEPAASTSTSASSGACPSRGDERRRPRHDPRAGGAAAEARRHPRASLHAPSRRLRRTARARCIRSSRKRSRDGPQDRRRPRLALQLSRWRASRSTPASCRTRWAPTCTATTRACPKPQRARRTSIRTRSTCSSARRASRSSRR